MPPGAKRLPRSAVREWMRTGTTIDRSSAGTTSAHAGNKGAGVKFALPADAAVADHGDVRGQIASQRGGGT